MRHPVLTITFTQVSHDRGIKTWCTSVSYPQCVFYGNKFRYETFNVECQWTPTLEKQQSVRKELLQRAKNHYQRRVVLIETVFWKCRQKSGRAWPATKKLCGNADGKRPCLGNGQTVLMRTPTQAQFVECWSEAIIRNGLPPALVDIRSFGRPLSQLLAWDKTLKLTTQVLQPTLVVLHDCDDMKGGTLALLVQQYKY